MPSYDELTLSVHTRADYERLLAAYPLLHGYWIRYARFEFAGGDNAAALNVYNRALDVLPRNLQLWVDYLRYLITINTPPPKVLPEFARAEQLVGSHFLSHEFWDLWLEYVDLYRLDVDLAVDPHAGLSPTAKILFHILRSKTLHQFTRYYKRLVGLQVLEETELHQLYMKQQQRVTRVWKFEKLLHRPFYHPRPLPKAQRKAWQDYIVWISPAEKPRLYEWYLEINPDPQIWLQYLRWQMGAKLEPSFDKAIRTKNPDIMLYYALWLEYKKDIDGARDIYSHLTTGPAIVQYAQFSGRHGGSAREILEQHTDKIEVLSELAKYDPTVFDRQPNTPEILKAWVAAQPERADEIYERGLDDASYLDILKRTNVRRFIEMDRILNRSALG